MWIAIFILVLIVIIQNEALHKRQIQLDRRKRELTKVYKELERMGGLNSL